MPAILSNEKKTNYKEINHAFHICTWPPPPQSLDKKTFCWVISDWDHNYSESSHDLSLLEKKGSEGSSSFQNLLHEWPVAEIDILNFGCVEGLKSIYKIYHGLLRRKRWAPFNLNAFWPFQKYKCLVLILFGFQGPSQKFSYKRIVKAHSYITTMSSENWL